MGALGDTRCAGEGVEEKGGEEFEVSGCETVELPQSLVVEALEQVGTIAQGEFIT